MRKNMVYIDANVFVQAVLRDESEIAASYAKSVLRKIAERDLTASTTVLTWDELVWACRKAMTFEDALEKGKMLLKTGNLTLEDATKSVINKASELAEKYGIKPRDAIHAATAILGNEKEIISDDADFDRVKELKRITLAKASR
ncbi:type II toxin-antitoxin system VapC family toxin [Candidatus Woesearchaeota archaeon]|nr:type II toxin-antitoxin system VapC family toxin [Candidatus Woesearchaeota archaeon]